MRKCLPGRWVKLIAVMVLIVMCIAAGTGTAFAAAHESVDYTVDFSYSVNGRVYEFSLSGGGKIALSELIEALGILEDAFDDVDSFLMEVHRFRDALAAQDPAGIRNLIATANQIRELLK